MKTNTIGILCVSIGLFFTTGCQQVKSAIGRPVIPVFTNVVPEVKVIPGSTTVTTNGTNVITTIVPESYQTNYATEIVYAVNPATTTTIERLQAVNSGLNPTPTAPFINWGLGLVTVVLGVVARFKTKQSARHKEDSSRVKDLLHTVISGVEAANSPAVKEKIAEFSRLKKHEKDLNAVVQEHTT